MEITKVQELISLIRQNDKYWKLVKELDAGYGDYGQAKEIAEIVGDTMADVLIKSGTYTEEEIQELARQAYILTTMVTTKAQNNLNAAAKVGLKPQTAAYPVSAVAEAITKIMDAQDVEKVIRDVIPTMIIQVVDYTVQKNARFQYEAGLQPVIVREWSGSYPSHDTKHTDWCRDLAGTYNYGEEPQNVYVRHAGCRCTVKYYPSRSTKGRLTALAKGEVDMYAELWNTDPLTLDKRLKKQMQSLM